MPPAMSWPVTPEPIEARPERAFCYPISSILFWYIPWAISLPVAVRPNASFKDWRSRYLLSKPCCANVWHERRKLVSATMLSRPRLSSSKSVIAGNGPSTFLRSVRPYSTNKISFCTPERRVDCLVFMCHINKGVFMNSTFNDVTHR